MADVATALVDGDRTEETFRHDQRPSPHHRRGLGHASAGCSASTRLSPRHARTTPATGRRHTSRRETLEGPRRRRRRRRSAHAPSATGKPLTRTRCVPWPKQGESRGRCARHSARIRRPRRLRACRGRKCHRREPRQRSPHGRDRRCCRSSICTSCSTDSRTPHLRWTGMSRCYPQPAGRPSSELTQADAERVIAQMRRRG